MDTSLVGDIAQETGDIRIEDEQLPDGPPAKIAKGIYNWQNKDFIPIIHEFNPNNSGCKIDNLPASPSPLDVFECFFTKDFMESITDQTNRYYEYLSRQNNDDSSRLKRWKPADYKEMYCFLAVTIFMPQLKKLNVSDYWTTDSYLSTPIFGRLMKRDRYLLIMRLLHFTDNDAEPVEGDSLRKIRSVVDHLKTTFKSNFYPFQNLCIDESLLLYKGRLYFKQYIPSKRHRFGVKFFLLCDCETGYVLDFIIYTGVTTDVEEYTAEKMGKSGEIVMTLLAPYLNKGHTLFVDNWYSSPTLFSHLHDKKTNTCGTVKPTRKFMPKLSEKLNRGEVIHKSTDNLLVMKWQDKREVRMLTSCYTAEMKDTGKTDHLTGEKIYKPKCIVEYNNNMGSVDKSDMLLSSIESVRKTIKWYKKVFFHLLDLAVLNSYQLYKTKTGENIPLSVFQLNLVKKIIEKYHTPLARTSGGRRAENAECDLRLTERHFPSHVPPTTYKTNPSKRCVVCEKQKRRKETRYMCAICHAALCIVPCFELYHTKKNFT